MLFYLQYEGPNLKLWPYGIELNKSDLSYQHFRFYFWHTFTPLKMLNSFNFFKKLVNHAYTIIKSFSDFNRLILSAKIWTVLNLKRNKSRVLIALSKFGTNRVTPR